MGSIKTHRLIEKGWRKSDINKTIKITGNFVISVALIPELIALKGYQLYLIIITLGISFGLLFELLLRTIEHLNAKHHLFLGIIVPVLAVINIVIVSNNMKRLVGLENPQNPLAAGIVY